MMKYLQITLIFALILFCSYLYIDRKNAVKSYSRKISALDVTIKNCQEDCETKIAFIKAEKDRQISNKKIKSEIPSIRDIIEKLPINPEKIQENTLSEISATLKLDEKQGMQVNALTSEFEKAKGLVFEKCMRENIFILGAEHRDMINAARRDTMGKLGLILSEEQLKIFKENDFDLKLGFREMGNTVGKVR